ncbi:B-cell receptor CD22-like [Perca flavescens]|uniref:B-cell receptor CD22-like n=1 Tax=Perca flavescens TaxID=8167 RepID=UPI00106EA79D|nr:B-cell receptor CD22-like [Perca flavescens]
MAVWDRKISCCFTLLLAGALGQSVNYPDRVCAVKGSTITLPCSFTPLKSVNDNGREVLIEVVRVVWCKNHETCFGETPSVFDSESQNNDPRYRYLGDKKGDCTLQISDLQEEDEATFRLRVETNDPRASFTGLAEVSVTVTDQMEIRSSRDDREFKRGEEITLSCSAATCTIHQLEVSWFRDSHALCESGPTLHLSYLTAKDSGNYSCGLKTNNHTLSVPYSLQVEAEEEGTKAFDPLLAVRLLLFTLHTVLIVIVTAIIIKRTCVGKKKMTV